MTEKQAKKSFVKGAAILGIAGIFVQILGAVFRIPLANIIGDDGMGYYQTAYPIYVALLVFSTNGAPAAISKMTSEKIACGQYSEAHRIFKLSFLLMGAMGVAFFLAVVAFAKPLVLHFADIGAYPAMIAIAPALLFVPIMAVFRGYFQGMQEMMPTAISQFFEQVVRVALGLALAGILVKKGIDMAAAGATAGTSVGPLFGILVLYVFYIQRRKGILMDIDAESAACLDSPEFQAENGASPVLESAGSVLKRLALIAIPITIGVSIMPVMNLGDLLFVMRRLQDIGFSSAEANALYGRLSGMAIPIINVPMALALSMAMAMVPAIAAAASAGDRKGLEDNIRMGLRTSMIIGVPCSLGLISMAYPVTALLYPRQPESIPDASACLLILAAGVVFLCVGQTMAGVLQGIGRPGLSVAGLLAGFAVKCVSTYILTAIPAFGVEGAAAGSALGFAAVGIFNFAAVKAVTGIKHDISLAVVRPVLAGIIMFAAVKAAYYGLNMVRPDSHLVTLLVICIAAGVYGIAILKLKAVSADELETFPKGKALKKLLTRLHLV